MNIKTWKVEEVRGGAVMDDMGEESLHCTKHPYRRSPNPGGICGFCLEEKLGKLLSSSQSIPSFFPSTSLSPGDKSSKVVASGGLSRSKSSAPIRRHGEEYSPRKGGFWSFLHLSSRMGRESNKNVGDLKTSVHPTAMSRLSEMSYCGDEDGSPGSSHASAASFGQKVARSRSVGCGSRSFSGDLLERISTGFGDCALRRVESQREAKHLPKGLYMCSRMGMGMARYDKNHHGVKNGVGTGSHTSSGSPQARSKSWGWALASPMRVFKSSPKAQKKNASKANATAPNLGGIPALLMVGN